VIGVSGDPLPRQRDFAASVGAPFPMVGDPEGKIGDLYGVRWPLLGVDRRITFVVDKRGLVRGILKHELQVDRHLTEALECLRRL
jgi:thioredoxin-dependent peroxiredoxin